MAKKRTAIDVLLESSGSSNRPLARRVTLEVRNAIDSDLRAVIAAEKQYKPTPSLTRLRDYIEEEYHVSVCRSSVATWLVRLRKAGEK